jgi:hypothetical protein
VEQTAREVWDAQTVIERLNDVLRLFRDSVSASRGYAPNAVQLHRQSVESIQSAVRDVRQGTTENSDKQQRLRFLEATLDQAIALEWLPLEARTHLRTYPAS